MGGPAVLSYRSPLGRREVRQPTAAPL